MMILFLLPVYQIRFSFFGLPITLLEVMILSCFIVWFFRETNFISFIKRKYSVKDYLHNRHERSPYPFRHEIALILLVSYIAVGLAGFSHSALGIWKAYFFEPLLVFILILNILGKRGKKEFDFEKIFLPLAISALVISLFAIFQRVSGLFIVDNFWPRVTGVFVYPNALGLFLSPIVMLSIGAILNYKLQITHYKFWLYLSSIILSVLACVLAGSEGALVGILAASLIVGLFIYSIRFRVLSYLARGGVILFFCFTLLSPIFFLKVVPEYKYFNFSSDTLNYLTDKLMLKDFSGEVRKQQWRETWEMMTEDPRTFILGTGLSAYQRSVAPYHQEGIFFNKDRDTDFRRKIVWFDEQYKAQHWRPVEIYMYPHNLVLNFWTELGLLGMALFVWIFGKTLLLINSLLKSSQFRGLALGFLGAMLVVLIHGLVDVPYFKNDLSVMFWVILAGVSALDLKIKVSSYNGRIFK
jgi:O-antigen ligase